MGILQVGEMGLAEPVTPVQASGSEVLAGWISHICNPPVMTTTSLVLTGYTLSGQAAWLWTTFYILLAVLVPALYVVWLFQRGVVTDLHLTVREERTRPLVITLGATLAAWMALTAGDAPHLLTTLAAAHVLQGVIFFGITLHWKISAHCAAAAMLTLIVWLLGGTGATAVVAIIPLIAWARVRLRHHTPAQTVAGGALGGSILASAFYIWGM